MDRIDELREAYRDGRLILFVGAGVSMSRGLPPWISVAGPEIGVRRSGTRRTALCCEALRPPLPV